MQNYIFSNGYKNKEVTPQWSKQIQLELETTLNEKTT